MARYNSIIETVGNTPVVRINKLAPKGVNLYVKVEAFNPLGSVKDRLALGVIEAAEKGSGALKPGQTVVEATSGNTGIGLAMVCAAKGYPLVITMAESFSVERRKLMRFLGAKVVLTPAAAARHRHDRQGRSNWRRSMAGSRPASSRTTPTRAYHAQDHGRQEILADFEDERLDYFVTGFGTGGTLNGVARVLAKESPRTKLVVCEPADAPMLTSGQSQPRNPDGTPSTGHPAWKPHPMQGWSPDFIPKITGEVDFSRVHKVLTITNAEAMKSSQDLAAKEGIFVGITSGANLAGALEVAKIAPPGSNILTILADTGERYLSTPLFANIPADMTEEELALVKSTPSAQPIPAA
jgi:cysteine synthase A